MSARPEMVQVLVSLDYEASDLRTWRLVHADGRLFTEAETELVKNARAEDLRAAADVHRAQAEEAERQAEYDHRLVDLITPYALPTTPVSDVLPLMPRDERAEAEEILALLRRPTPAA